MTDPQPGPAPPGSLSAGPPVFGPLAWLNDLTRPAPPPQAADPAHLANGMVLPRPAPAPLPAESFSVDLTHAPDAIAALTEARDELGRIRQEAAELGRVRAPSADAVSHDAATALGATATGGAGSFAAALDAGLRRLDDLIGHLTSELADYRRADEAGSSLGPNLS